LHYTNEEMTFKIEYMPSYSKFIGNKFLHNTKNYESITTEILKAV